MKSLIIYGSYGCYAMLAEIEKETDPKELKDYKEPEKLYKVTNKYLDCKYSDIDIKSILKDINYYSDNIGFVGSLMESYVVPLDNEQFCKLKASTDEKLNDTINYYNKRIEEYYNADFLERSSMLSKITGEIGKLDISTREKIHNNLLNVIRKINTETLDKAKETGEKQILSKMMVRCNNPKEECNFDVIIEYITPENDIEEVRQHTY